MPAEYVIFVNKHLQKSGYVWLVLFVLGLIAGYCLHQWNGAFFDWVTAPFSWLLALFFSGLSLNAHVNRGRKVIFSADDQAVYRQTLFGKKQLMTFADIGAIKPYSTNFGVTYFALFGRANLFGRNPVRVSPQYSASPKSERAYAEFEHTVLPQLWTIINREQVSRPRNLVAIRDADLVYFQKDNNGYRLKSGYNHDTWSYAIIVILLGVSVLILLSPTLRLKFFSYALGTGLGALLMAFLLTEKKYFQDGHLFSEYTAGLFRKSYPLPQFSTFQVTHRRRNFVYVGTDVSMIFNQQNNQRPVFLCQMRQTEKIEALINETKYIVDQQVQRPAA